ncbi:MAG: hypothetical protein KGH64_03160 [Candidatus Micrarchaeota archaeon]|nr:hypothetical protein [Candidatus Micrarchaeota archaeon]MDE1859572.1 hypothetical protein [Candidatus Micrarchaeota archaeon]
MRHKQEVASEQDNPESAQASGPAPKGYKEYVLFLGIYLALALLVFWPITINITNTVAAGNPYVPSAGTGDIYQNLWNLWWVKYAILTLHAPIYFTHMLDYPIGASLVTQTLSPLAAILSIPFQQVSLAFAYNVVFFIGYAFSGLFMFLLAYYLIGNKSAAFVAGVVFEFSPFHMMHSLGGQLNWANIEFIPLFILFFLMMIRTKKPAAVIGTAASFVFLFFFGDPEQAIIASVCAALIFLLSLIKSESRNEILDRKLLVALPASAVMALVIGSPLFIPIIQGVMSGALSQANAQNPLPGNLIWSDPILSYFLPGPFNNLSSGLSLLYYSIYAATAGPERVSYIGYTVLLLAILAVFWDIDKNGFKSTPMWIATGIIMAWLSLGPYVQLGSPPQNIQGMLPGLYLLYSKVPILNIVREPARFDVIVTMCLAILAGFGFAQLMRMLKERHGSSAAPYAICAATFLIIMECSGIPFSSGYVNEYFLTLHIPAGYYQIANVTGNFSVMALPSMDTPTLKPELFLGAQMYYQTAFHKPLISGYTSRVNATEEYSRISIPLSIEASSLENGGAFQYLSPISENYTNVTLFLLYKDNIRFVSVINQAYNFTQLYTIKSYLDSALGMPFYQDSSSLIYYVNSTRAYGQQNSIIAYTSGGAWIYGCGAFPACNSSLNSFWWGGSLRVINVSVPQDKTRLRMSFTVQPSISNSTLSIYLDSDKHRLGIVELPQAATTYYLNLNLSPGMNQLYLITLNSTAKQPATDFAVGIKNVTFAAR